ncbi:hypothetical protein L218DRAFT_883797, partial [Marasmius fiardii PR-910]
MIDSGSSVVLIRDSVVNTCGLRTLPLQEPIALDNAFSDNSPSSSPSSPLLLDRCVELHLEDRSSFWTSKPVFAIISPSLVSDVILGMPFITTNRLLLDPNGPSIIVKGSGFDLLNPSRVPVASIRELKCLEREERRINRDLYCTVIDELNSRVDGSFRLDPVVIEKAPKPSAIVAAVHEHVENLAFMEKCQRHCAELKDEFKDIFEPLPPVSEMPDDVLCTV